MRDPKDIAALVRELAALLDETGLTEIEYRVDEWQVRVAKDVTTVAPVPVVTQGGSSVATPTVVASAEPDTTPAGAITSPMVGTAYLSPEPGSPPFVETGDEVKEGQTLLLIEAMKTFNEIRAPKSGRIAEVKVQNGAPVEFGDTLMILS
jgi:acetyl-CoA carboxylase biotin carboxyl carrier protein